ncbi:hypothetical protein HUT16_33045 [Kitasatospora sp. NA04385]|uniref:nSTAND1 domain-containing NTPase n=1 Tax=Kitasatospora sp. NA04385 TaxID=2742135 RepID=UPI0015929E02|nr:trypsin-like peptidase domain-containing protein [Kitasatospora sp. NA04385]QKW23274.1 hypothetical protein HUT16_33045 [Kitasatospora sp. NA04385]
MTGGQEEAALARGLVRVLAADGRVVGAGFLVGADVVCTCAHVVAQALGLPGTAERAPADEVAVDFPLLRGAGGQSGRADGGGGAGERGAGGTGPVRAAVVESWRPVDPDGGGDVALLRLREPVPGSRPMPLVDGDGVWDHPFRVLGFPRDADHGVWASGVLRAHQGAGWLQMETARPGRRIAPGFSGSPVWDDAQGGAVGMTVAVERGTDTTTAYLIPSAALVDGRVLRPACPFRGLAPFTEDDAELFHGRRADTARILAAVGRGPVTLVVGPSGSGKSSLVRAGLLPGLRRERRGAVSELRTGPGLGAAAVLAQALAPLLAPDNGDGDDGDGGGGSGGDGVERARAAAELAALLADGPARGAVLAELRGQLLERTGGRGHLLFVDQLEEYAAADPAAAAELLELLLDLGAPGPGAAAPALTAVATARPESLDTLITARTADRLSGATQYLAQLSAEQLREAVTAPVAHVPGLRFEEGLPARILADAADEPGRTPLVQFALTRLWELREGAALTHAAYESLGGVAGALVGYAEECLEHLPGPGGPDRARRLFTQLARPNGSGGFARQPARTADLDPELRALAHRLAPTRLVVLGRAADGAQTVDLAHEALTVLWPRLHDWLEDSRDFRRWQEELREALARWSAHDREPSRLLRGSALAEAADRLARHPEDIPAAERAYIGLSARHRRREVRTWRAVTACLTVLALLAGSLAYLADRSRRQVTAQLRTQVSRLLAGAAEQRAADEPARSLQLALAAWSTDRTPEAFAALLREYPGGQYLTGARAGLWPGRFENTVITPDGGTMVVQSTDGEDRHVLTVVTDPLGPAPAHRPLPEQQSAGTLDPHRAALSRDGRWFALTAPDGRVLLWDLPARAPARVLEPADTTGRRLADTSLDFSGDGRRLLLKLTFYDESAPSGQEDRTARISLWETERGRPLPTAPDLARGIGGGDIALAADPDHLAVGGEYLGPGWAASSVRDVATGRDLRVLPPDPYGAPLVADGGERLVGPAVPPYAGTPGRPGASYSTSVDPAGPPVVLDTGDGELDRTGRFLVSEAVGSGQVDELLLTDVRTARTYRTRVPATGGEGRETIRAVVAAEDGAPTVLLPDGETLLTAGAGPADLPTWSGHGPTTADGALSPDGSLLAEADEDVLTVFTVATGSRRTVRTRSGLRRGFPPVWTADSRRLVLRLDDESLVSYAVDDLSGPVTDVDLPRDTGRPARSAGVEAVEPLDGAELAVLTADGLLLRADAATGGRVGPPLDVERRSGTESGTPFPGGQLRARPGHPGQVVLVTGTNSEGGTVELWNLRTGTREHAFTVGPLPYHESGTPSGLLISPDGGRLAVARDDRTIRQWDIDSGTPLPGGADAITSTEKPFGYAPGNRLITKDVSNLRFWDLASGTRIALLDVPLQLGVRVIGDRLVIAGEVWYQDLDLRPERMARALCRGAARDFTAAERALLPAGAPGDAPCAAILRDGDG